MPPLRPSTRLRHLIHTRELFLASCFMFISLGVVAAWFISADASSSITGLEPYIRFMLSPWMLVTHVLALSFLAFGLWFLGTPSLQPSAVSNFDVTLRQCSRLLTLVLLLFAAALAVVGFLFVDDLRVTFRSERLSQERGIARLKAQQVDKWLLDRSLDTQALAQALRSLPLDRLTDDREARQIAGVIFGESLAGNPDRIGIALFARDGAALVEAGATADAIARRAAYLAAMPEGDRRLTTVDVHLRDGSSAALAMDFVLPLVSNDGKATVLAVLVLTADPGRALFKEIVVWPTDSPGSEVVIVRRDGDSLLLLTEPALLGRTPAPLSFRLPLSRDDLPGVQALRRGDGAREGTDYRGVPVYSASAHVTGVPWQVVAKTDIAAAMAPWRYKTAIVAAVIAATIASAAFMVVLLWRGQRTSYRTFRAAQIEERKAIARHFEGLVRLARDPIFLVDANGRFVDCNDAALRSYGYSADEFRTLTVGDIRPPEARADVERQFKAAADPNGAVFETIHRRKDGTTFPVEVSTRAFDVDGQPFRQSFVRDISRRKDLEGEVQRLSRVQKALHAANGILLRAQSEAQLFEGMCDVIVHMGGYRLAFIGVAVHDDAKTVAFAAIVGLGSDHLKAAGIRWDDGPQGQGPTAMALKTGEIEVQQDFAHNPGVETWRDELMAEHFGSGISLPIRSGGSLIATLTIYAVQADAFNAEEVDLLTGFVDDLSYGIGALRTRAGIDPTQSVRAAAG